MSNCRSCNAEIEFVKTKNGKQMPMDVAESPCAKCYGDGYVMGADGPPRIVCAACSGVGRRRLSHFATCPTAAQHRKVKP